MGHGELHSIALGLEGKAHQVARLVPEEKPAPADVIGRLSETNDTFERRKKHWSNQAFGGQVGNH